MPFVCGGHPRAGVLGDVLRGLERGGASIAEIGIPFSDPIADGPTVAAAMHKALVAGVTPRAIFEEVRAARASLSIGLVAMCSVSIVLKMGGPGTFSREAAAAGFDGLIVPDVPLEESESIRRGAVAAGLTCSLLVSPNTPEQRAGDIMRASSGFVYLLARSGITGEREDAPEVGPAVAALRKGGPLPIACGFGISTAAHVRAVVGSGAADAAIVGSAMVRRLESAADPAAEAERFTRELAGGLAG